MQEGCCSSRWSACVSAETQAEEQALCFDFSSSSSTSETNVSLPHFSAISSTDLAVLYRRASTTSAAARNKALSAAGSAALARAQAAESVAKAAPPKKTAPTKATQGRLDKWAYVPGASGASGSGAKKSSGGVKAMPIGKKK